MTRSEPPVGTDRSGELVGVARDLMLASGWEKELRTSSFTDLQAKLHVALGGPIRPAPRGRDAIVLALREAGIAREDHVCVVTTSGSGCVSPCVSWALGRWSWGRRPTDRTRAVLLIHEWGIPHAGSTLIAAACRERGWALIEDCAHALGTALWRGAAGRHGDWAVYSLPKFTAVHQGGILRGPDWWSPEALPVSWTGAVLPWLVNPEVQAARYRGRSQRFAQVASEFGGEPVVRLGPDAVPWKLPLRHRRIHGLAARLAAGGSPIETCVHTWAALLPCDPVATPD